MGFFVSVCSMTFTLIALTRKLFFDISVSGYASLIIAITFIGGIQLMVLGILGEYVDVIIDEVENRPTYFVDKSLLTVELKKT